MACKLQSPNYVIAFPQLLSGFLGSVLPLSYYKYFSLRTDQPFPTAFSNPSLSAAGTSGNHRAISQQIYQFNPIQNSSQPANMPSSDLAIEGVQSSSIIEMISNGIKKMGESEKKDQMKKINGIFQMNVKSAEGKEGQWTIDFKKEGKVYQGQAKPKADVVISLSDATFQSLADGKLNGQKAFMSGQLKVKGNVMLATKLDVLLKTVKSKL